MKQRARKERERLAEQEKREQERMRERFRIDEEERMREAEERNQKEENFKSKEESQKGKGEACSKMGKGRKNVEDQRVYRERRQELLSKCRNALDRVEEERRLNNDDKAQFKGKMQHLDKEKVRDLGKDTKGSTYQMPKPSKPEEKTSSKQPSQHHSIQKQNCMMDCIRLLKGKSDEEHASEESSGPEDESKEPASSHENKSMVKSSSQLILQHVPALSDPYIQQKAPVLRPTDILPIIPAAISSPFLSPPPTVCLTTGLPPTGPPPTGPPPTGPPPTGGPPPVLPAVTLSSPAGGFQPPAGPAPLVRPVLGSPPFAVNATFGNGGVQTISPARPRQLSKPGINPYSENTPNPQQQSHQVLPQHYFYPRNPLQLQTSPQRLASPFACATYPPRPCLIQSNNLTAPPMPPQYQFGSNQLQNPTRSGVRQPALFQTSVPPTQFLQRECVSYSGRSAEQSAASPSISAGDPASCSQSPACESPELLQQLPVSFDSATISAALSFLRFPPPSVTFASSSSGICSTTSSGTSSGNSSAFPPIAALKTSPASSKSQWKPVGPALGMGFPPIIDTSIPPPNHLESAERAGIIPRLSGFTFGTGATATMPWQSGIYEPDYRGTKFRKGETAVLNGERKRDQFSKIVCSHCTRVNDN